MAKRRKFTPQFKVQVVLELLREESSQAELCRRYNLGSDQMSRWRKQFLERAPQIFTNENTCQEYLERVSYLEQLVGRLTLELEISKKTLSSFTLSHKNKGSW